jgi:starvation-inducible DNA-binding protein
LVFEEQYNELALAVDSIAERIRALGFPAPGAYSVYARLCSIKEEVGVPAAEDVSRQLVMGQEAVTRTARGLFRCSTRSVTNPRLTCLPTLPIPCLLKE